MSAAYEVSDKVAADESSSARHENPIGLTHVHARVTPQTGSVDVPDISIRRDRLAGWKLRRI